MSFWYHLYPRYEEGSTDRFWVIRKLESSRASAKENRKREAFERAKEMARGKAYGVVIYNTDGERHKVWRTSAGEGKSVNEPKSGYPVGTYKWDVGGEAPVEQWHDFVEMLERGRIDKVRLDLSPNAPNWGEPRLPFAKSAQKPRGKYLFAEVGMATNDMRKLQGELGKRMYNTSRRDFMSQVREDDIEEYAQMFRDGERPGPFIVELNADGTWYDSQQEGRHRILAAQEAGISEVPALILFNSRNIDRFGGEEGVDYLTRYE